MDATFFLYVVFVYALIILVGMFLVPAVFSEKTISKLTRRINSFETGHRDDTFLFLIRPLVRLGIHPNVITLIGFVLVFVLGIAFWRGASPAALFLIALFAGLSDMFDGILARASKKVTSLGGMLDGLRDFLLLVALTVGGMYQGFFPVKEMIWFLIGALVIGILKFVEIVERRQEHGFKSAFRKRAGGDGKLSIDRIKFFFYVTACLGLILGQVMGRGVETVGYWSLMLSIAFAIMSVLFHSAIIRFTHERQKA